MLRAETLEKRMVLSGILTVTNANDQGLGSLRQAVEDANLNLGSDTIVFARSVHGITLTSGELTISDDVTIDGPGARRLTISGGDTSRVFSIDPGVNATIADLAITDGFADADAAHVPSVGGGILNRGQLSLRDVVMDGNRSLGDPDILDASEVLVLGPAFKTAGGAAGGAVANFGVLDVVDSNFRDNRADAADHVDFTPTQIEASAFPFGVFPGNSFGGAISNFTTDYGTAELTVSDSHFIGNVAQAGDGGVGDFAAIAGGGAIGNDSALTVIGSEFIHNNAIGGDGSESPFHNGHALGGAISTGSLTPGLGLPVAGGSMTVTGSDFTHNRALGGDDNIVTLPLSAVPRADAPNNAYGGAILVFQGSADIDGSLILSNQAVAGEGGAEQNGSLAAGGGIFFFNFLGGVTGSVNDSIVSHNRAIGGEGPTGGDGLGGGIAMGSLGAPFGATGQITISHSLLSMNRAEGGRGRAGLGGSGQGGGIANLESSSLTVSDSLLSQNRAIGGRGTQGGGNGEGGGIYNIAGSSSTLLHSIVFANWARGGIGTAGSDDGLGQGGGLFNQDGGQFELDAFSERWVRLNHATDDGDDVFGDFVVL